MMNFLELRVKSITTGQENNNFVPIIFSCKFINCIAPYKVDEGYSIIKCEDKSTYICNLPYDEIKKMLGENVIASKGQTEYDSSEWYI